MTSKAILSIGAALLVLPAALQAQTQLQSTSSGTTGRAAAATTGSTAPAGTAAMTQSPGTTSAATTGRTSASASTPQTAAAATGGKVVAGAMVMDTKGGSVGTIESVSGDLAVLDTGSHKVSLPLSSFAAGTTGPIISMTKAEVDAAAGGAAEADKAALAAMLTQGAQVTGPEGNPVGTIEANDGQFITLAMTGATKVKLPVSAFAKGANGPVVSMTAAQIDAAVKSSGG